MTTMYDIKNCSTVKKAQVWLESNGIDYTFVDFKKTPPEASLVKQWIDSAGVETVINKRGTTWKKLTEEEQSSILDLSNLELVTNNPSTVKRPVLETNGDIHFGFKEDEYNAIFS